MLNLVVHHVTSSNANVSTYYNIQHGIVPMNHRDAYANVWQTVLTVVITL